MRIQLQNEFFFPRIGGIETHLFYAAKTFISLGDKPTILCSRHAPELPVQDNYQQIPIIRHPAWAFPGPLYTIKPFAYTHALFRYMRHNKGDYDAIWAGHPYYAHASSKIYKEIPVIYVQAAVYPKVLDFLAGGLNRIEQVGFRLFNPQNYQIERKAILGVDQVVTISTARMTEIIDYYKVDRDKFRVVPPGIDLQRFFPQEPDLNLRGELGIPKGSRVILTVCRLSPEKNVRMLIEAFEQMNRPDCYLVIVGDGVERTDLEHFAAETRHPDNIRFAGLRVDTERFYTIADVFVLSSTYEGFGLVFLEAMASGVPCIGLKSDYPRTIVATEEIIQDRITGLISLNSSQDLAEKISNLLDDDELRRRCAEASRWRCETTYSWREHIKSMKEIIDSI